MTTLQLSSCKVVDFEELYYILQKGEYSFFSKIPRNVQNSITQSYTCKALSKWNFIHTSEYLGCTIIQFVDGSDHFF